MHTKSPSKIWRKFANRYSLIGSRSSQSKKTYYPPIYVEVDTLNTSFQPENMPRLATLVTWSLVHTAPEGFEHQKPYVVGILEFENGQRFTSQVVDVDPESLKHGDILVPTFRKFIEDNKDGIIHYANKWTKPAQ